MVTFFVYACLFIFYLSLSPLVFSKPVAAFGVDPALRISVFDELSLGEGFNGVTQVQGFHSESRAFHFQGERAHTHTRTFSSYLFEFYQMTRQSFHLFKQ